VVVIVELAVIAWVRNRFVDTPLLSAAFQVVVGGLLVFGTGILRIASSQAIHSERIAPLSSLRSRLHGALLIMKPLGAQVRRIERRRRGARWCSPTAARHALR